MYSITFLNIPGHKEYIFTVVPPIGIMSMSALLKLNGHAVNYIDADVCRYSPSQVCDQLTEQPPHLIGISLNVSQVAHLEKYLYKIQTIFPKVEVVLGGPYVTAVKENIFKDFPSVRFVFSHEGEFALLDFLEYLSGRKAIENVRNLIWNDNGHIHINRIERIIELDSLPMPDYSLLAGIIDKYGGAEPSIASPSIAIMCTRGCPYNCTFCSSPVTWGRKMTFRSIKSIINEIVYLKKTFDVKEIFFQDDTLNARRQWFFELCDAIIENSLQKDIFFKCPFKLNKNILDESLLKKAKEANFWMIFYGVESGNQHILNIINKKVSIEEIKRAFYLTRKNGICSYASFMIGNQEETKETIQDSITLLDEIKPDFGGFAIAAPFPGTKLYDIAVRENNIEISSFKDYQFGDSVMKTKSLSCNDIRLLAAKANNHFDVIVQSNNNNNADCRRLKKIIGEGLYGKELWHTWIRRTRKKVSIIIPNISEGTKLLLKIFADYPDIKDHPLDIQFIINKHNIYNYTLIEPAWTIISFPLQINCTQDISLEWEVSRTWNPKKEHINNNDNRDLGVTVEYILIE